MTLFESTTHFNNVTKQNRVVMLNKTFWRRAQGGKMGVLTDLNLNGFGKLLTKTDIQLHITKI